MGTIGIARYIWLFANLVRFQMGTCLSIVEVGIGYAAGE